MTVNGSMLVIQDDCYPGALHLDEVLLSAIPDADVGAAAFAFVTSDGLNAIFNSEEFRGYCKKGNHFELYVGIDSITNTKTLDFAKSLSKSLNDRLKVKVYFNAESRDIFHPKTTWFRNAKTGGGIAFIGSGNLTMRGLQSNTEMFSWIEQDEYSFSETLNTWYGWLESAISTGYIFDVDDPVVLEKAKSNRWGGSQSRAPELSVREIEPYGENALLVSCIPSQYSRGWSQFAMAKQYYRDYFGFEIDESDGTPAATGSRRVLISAVNDDGSVCPAESRAGNISRKSKNFRMEIEAARGLQVPHGNPAVVFIKTGARSYLYEVVNTDSRFYHDLMEFARQQNPNLKSTEHPKCWCDVEPLREIMPTLPILNAHVSENNEGE